MAPARPGFTQLDPQEVMAALDAVGLRGDGRLLQLNSYENRVFQVFLETGDAVVAKFYRPARWTDAQILEEHAYALELAAAEVPVVAPFALTGARPVDANGSETLRLLGPHGTLAELSHDSDTWRYAVAPRKAGRGPELEDPETLRWIGRFLGRLHAVGAQGCFAHRRRMDPRSEGPLAVAAIERSHTLTPAEAPAWLDACRRALEAVEAAFDRAGPLASLRLHGDCHPGNILWREEGPHVVDLDDACMGPAVQDLWMLLPGDAEGARVVLGHLLEGYEQFREFDDRELTLIEPLRTLRMVRHSAWLADRWHDPAFPVAFPYFGTAAYWSEQTTLLREQVLKLEG